MKYYKIERKSLEDIVKLTIYKSEEIKLAEREKVIGFIKLKLSPIKVNLSKNGVTITIYVRTIFNKNILSVCEMTSKDIKSQIEKKTDIKVKDIFVNVMGVYE